MLTTRFTELVGCRVPIQQAGMGGVASPELALAVAEAGGLGMLGGVLIPAPVLAEMLGLGELRALAAGGIGTGRAMAAALAAGAAGVRVGTRFVAAEEANAHPVYRDAVIRAAAQDTVLTEAFSVMWPNAPHRVLRS